MELKDRIKKLRKYKGLSATQLAGQFSKTEAAIRAWEIGRSKPDADTLIELAKYFDCTTDYLLGISESKFNIELEELESYKNTLGELNDIIKSLGKLSQERFIRLAEQLHELSEGERLEILDFISDYTSLEFTIADRRVLHGIFKGIAEFSITQRQK